MPTIYSD